MHFLLMVLLLVSTALQSADSQPFKRVMRSDRRDHYGFNRTSFNNDGDKVLTVDDCRIQTWDIETEKPLNTHEDSSDIFSAEWSPDGKHIAFGAEGVHLWDTNTEETIQLGKYDEKWFSVHSLGFDRTGEQLVFSDRNSIYLQDLQANQTTTVLKLDDDRPVYSIMFDRERKLLLFGGSKGPVYVWDIRANKQACLLPGHTGLIKTAKWNESETKVVSASWDKTARIFDIKMNKELQCLTHYCAVTSAEFYKEDQVLTANNERTICIRDINTKGYKQLLPLGGVIVALNKSKTRIASVPRNGKCTVEVMSLPLFDHITNKWAYNICSQYLRIGCYSSLTDQMSKFLIEKLSKEGSEDDLQTIHSIFMPYLYPCI